MLSSSLPPSCVTVSSKCEKRSLGLLEDTHGRIECVALDLFFIKTTKYSVLKEVLLINKSMKNELSEVIDNNNNMCCIVLFLMDFFFHFEMNNQSTVLHSTQQRRES